MKTTKHVLTVKWAKVRLVSLPKNQGSQGIEIQIRPDNSNKSDFYKLLLNSGRALGLVLTADPNAHKITNQVWASSIRPLAFKVEDSSKLQHRLLTFVGPSYEFTGNQLWDLRIAIEMALQGVPYPKPRTTTPIVPAVAAVKRKPITVLKTAKPTALPRAKAKTARPPRKSKMTTPPQKPKLGRDIDADWQPGFVGLHRK